MCVFTQCSPPSEHTPHGGTPHVCRAGPPLTHGGAVQDLVGPIHLQRREGVIDGAAPGGRAEAAHKMCGGRMCACVCGGGGGGWVGRNRASSELPERGAVQNTSTAEASKAVCCRKYVCMAGAGDVPPAAGTTGTHLPPSMAWLSGVILGSSRRLTCHLYSGLHRRCRRLLGSPSVTSRNTPPGCSTLRGHHSTAAPAGHIAITSTRVIVITSGSTPRIVQE
jgi:hypothetical protein